MLSLLAEQPIHGYQIITELAERSGGAWRASPGSVCPTLQQLEDEGLVTAAEQDGRRTYSLTEAGRAEVKRATAGRPAPWEELADEDGETARNLRSTAAQVMAAVVQVAHAGDERQRARAEHLLRETRKSLYRLLAEDDADGSDVQSGDGGASTLESGKLGDGDGPAEHAEDAANHLGLWCRRPVEGFESGRERRGQRRTAGEPIAFGGEVVAAPLVVAQGRVDGEAPGETVVDGVGQTIGGQEGVRHPHPG